jgi:hypothetical protein
MPVLLEQEMGAESPLPEEGVSSRWGRQKPTAAASARCSARLGWCRAGRRQIELPRGGAMTGPPVVPSRGLAMQVPARPHPALFAQDQGVVIAHQSAALVPEAKHSIGGRPPPADPQSARPPRRMKIGSECASEFLCCLPAPQTILAGRWFLAFANVESETINFGSSDERA